LELESILSLSEPFKESGKPVVIPRALAIHDGSEGGIDVFNHGASSN
jgi:hypothetical protein